MSCNCLNKKKENSFSCECDVFIHPVPLKIGAGLYDLPRQIGGFAEFRRAMLYAIYDKQPLNFFKARQPEDLGVMLLEMWAYICDSLTFYDKVICHEEYLKTAYLKPSLRKLVALLGYIPRPAVGSTAYLVAMAEGRKQIKIPAGTAFLSGGFPGNPPQRFETEDAVFIHPFVNKWNISTPPNINSTAISVSSLLVLPRMEINPGRPALIMSETNNTFRQPLWITANHPYSAKDQIIRRRISVANNIELPIGFGSTGFALRIPNRHIGLWTVSLDDTQVSITEDGTILVLNNLYRDLKAGDDVIITKGTDTRSFQVTHVTEVTRRQTAGDPVKIGDTTFQLPGISIPVTQLTLDRSLNAGVNTENVWTNEHRSLINVYHSFDNAGTIVNEPRTTLRSTDPITLLGNVDPPVEDHHPELFIFRDKNLTAVKAGGRLDFNTQTIDLDDIWQPELQLPVEGFGNVIEVSRGETVNKEILGNGDASQINQVFKLKKNPLTYLPSASQANAQGIANTLKIYVDGIRWKEVPSFYAKTAIDQIYIVRQNDDNESIIIFGDGIHGQRLPSGTDNVTATYRFGAGAAAPPEGSINQIASPVQGLRSVENPLPAGGGADSEHAEGLRKYAPRSVLTLGRAVSIQDTEAIVAASPGVHAVRSEWRWHGVRQAPVIQIWYIGDPGIEAKLKSRLKSVMDNHVMVMVEPAIANPTSFSIDVAIDEKYETLPVLRQLKQVFSTEENGIFSFQKIGIGVSIFRSQLFNVALQVEGTRSVRNILWNGNPMDNYGINPGYGHYFQFNENSLLINGSPAI